jgi:hypothetical protein
MKKTIIKCAVFSVSLFVIINIVSTLAYFRILSDFWMSSLQIFFLVAALPAYYFVKCDEEKLFVYPIAMTVSAALNFLLSLNAYVILSDNNIIGGWRTIAYLVGWVFIGCYFVVVLVIDLIIAVATYIKKSISNKQHD